MDPPVPVDVEVHDPAAVDQALADQIADTVRARLLFRSAVRFLETEEFGDAGYKTRLVARE